MRAFFCLELEPELQKELDRIMQILRQTPVKASWVKPENLHVTVKFLGEIDPALVPQLEVVGREALRQSGIHQAIEWQLDRLGAFPSLDRPRVVWVGSSKEPEAVEHLAAHLQGGLQQLGFKLERERFVTHITLGRVKESGPGMQGLAQALRSFAPFSYRARARALTLMESKLDPKGAIYSPIFRLPFS